MVGQRFVDEMLERGSDWQLTVFGEEPEPAYDRVALSSLFDGVEVDEALQADIDEFRTEMRALEDSSDETRALEELLSSCT